MDISKSFLKTAVQYNQLNQYIDKSQTTTSTTEKTQSQALADQIPNDTIVEDSTKTSKNNNDKSVTDDTQDLQADETKKAKEGQLKQPEISQSIKDMIASMAREKAKLFNTGCSERCGEPKTLLTVLERIEKDKDYTLDQYLEDVKELNLRGKEKRDLDTLYHMRKVEVDKYDECECEERKRRAKLLGYELKEQYGCCAVKKEEKPEKTEKTEKTIDIVL